MSLESPLEIVQNRQDSPDAFGIRVFQHVRFFALGAAAEIVEFGLAAEQAVHQLVLFLEQVVALGREGIAVGGRIRRSVSARGATLFVGIDSGFLRIHSSSLSACSLQGL